MTNSGNIYQKLIFIWFHQEINSIYHVIKQTEEYYKVNQLIFKNTYLAISALLLASSAI